LHLRVSGGSSKGSRHVRWHRVLGDLGSDLDEHAAARVGHLDRITHIDGVLKREVRRVGVQQLRFDLAPLLVIGSMVLDDRYTGEACV
jgi:hypothetical protein